MADANLMTFAELPASLENLLHHVDATRPTDQEIWRYSTIESFNAGANNLVYRIKHEGYDLACKFTIRDKRRRTRREFIALSAT